MYRNGVWYREEWESADRHLSDIERTKRVVQGAMQGLTDCLTFTVETEEDFSDGWLPTLDMKLRVNKANQIEYNFFEKPTGSSKCLQASTALNQNCLIRSLNNEVMRRLSNMNEHIPMEEKTEVLDNFSQKMVNSSHTVEVVRRVIVSGIKGHLRKVERCQREGKPFHRTAAASAKTRKSKKLTQKQNWFKIKASQDSESESDEIDRQEGRCKRRGGPGSRGGSLAIKVDKKSTRKIQPSTVLFCAYSKGAALQKTLKDVVDRLAPLVGFQMRVAERGGTTLGSMLSNKNLWTGTECWRKECKTCCQKGEKEKTALEEKYCMSQSVRDV